MGRSLSGTVFLWLSTSQSPCSVYFRPEVPLLTLRKLQLRDGGGRRDGDPPNFACRLLHLLCPCSPFSSEIWHDGMGYQGFVLLPFPGRGHAASLLFAILTSHLMKNHVWLPHLVLCREASAEATQLSLRPVHQARGADRSLLTWHRSPSLPGPLGSPGSLHTGLSAREGAERAGRHQQGCSFKALWRGHCGRVMGFWKFQLSRALSPVLKGSFCQQKFGP